jgi:hypothetical protein
MNTANRCFSVRSLMCFLELRIQSCRSSSLRLQILTLSLFMLVMSSVEAGGEYSSVTKYGVGAKVNQSWGTANAAFGSYTLLYSGGSYNTAVGQESLRNDATGDHNTGLGQKSLWSNTSGDFNTGLGSETGYSNQTGSNNIFLGYQAGYSETGSNKLYIDSSNTATPLIYGDFASDALTINGTLNSTGNIATIGTLTAASIMYSQGGIVNTGALTSTGNISTNANLSAVNITNSGTLNSTGNISTDGTLTADGIINDGTITSTGNISTNANLSAVNITNSGTLNSTGNISTDGTLTADGIINDGTITSTGNISTNANLSAVNITNSGTLNSTGNISTDGTLTADGIINDGTITSTGNISTSGTLTAAGNVIAPAFYHTDGTKMLSMQNGSLHLGPSSMIFTDSSVSGDADIMYSSSGKIQLGNSTTDSTTVVGTLSVQDPTAYAHAANKGYVDTLRKDMRRYDRRSVALSSALTALPTNGGTGSHTCGMGAGVRGGYTAMAVGCAADLADFELPNKLPAFIKNASINAGTSFLAHNDPDYTFKVGMSFNFGKSQSKGQASNQGTDFSRALALVHQKTQLTANKQAEVIKDVQRDNREMKRVNLRVLAENKTIKDTNLRLQAQIDVLIASQDDILVMKEQLAQLTALIAGTEMVVAR